jgi:imidazolonepropionase-like amidohydrolase
MQVICEEAHNAGKKVAVHAIGTKAIRNSIETGVDTIEHGVYLNEELALLMKEKGISLIPTLTAFTETLNPLYKRGERWIQLHAPLVEPNQKGLEIAHKVGVHIGMGLDSLGDLGKEVALMQKITGLNGIEIIKICTYNGAKILGIEKDLGSIEIGKIADLVILDDNPIEDITNIESTNTVIKEGDVYPVNEIAINTNYESEEYNSLIPELLK